VRILIDTHIYLWMLSCPARLNHERLKQITSPANDVFLSSISIVELMIKHSIGKINIEFDPLAMAKKTSLEILDFSGKDAMIVGSLPFHHKDPFDRMLIAQAIANELFLMSDDNKFPQYNCKII